MGQLPNGELPNGSGAAMWSAVPSCIQMRIGLGSVFRTSAGSPSAPFIDT